MVEEKLKNVTGNDAEVTETLENGADNIQPSVNHKLVLDKEHLELLLGKFKNKINFKSEEQSMKKEEFIKIIMTILNPENPEQEAMLRSSKDLFEKIDWKNKGVINWDDVCSYLLLEVKKDDVLEKQMAFIGKPHVVKFSSLKDNIAKVVPEMNPARFIMINKTGQLSMLSSGLSVTKQINIEESGEAEETGKKRRTKLWVTDCVCVRELNKLIIGTANRDLQFFDLASPHIVQQFHLYALPCAVLCMVYHYVPSVPYDQLWLFFGTDNGDVHWLKFHMATKGLFEMPFKKSDSCWKILFCDISNQSKYVSHQQFSHMHSDWVKGIQYNPQADLLFSCSNNGKDSLVYRSLNENKRKVYVFKVTKGIQCFAYSKDLALIATGGVDHVLRLWDPYVTAKPIAILKNHQTSVIDVLIYEPLQQVFSYSKDGVLISWDVKDHTALQCLNIKFPFTGLLLEHGNFPMLLVSNGNSNSLLIAAEDCVADIKLSSLGNQQNFSTHKASVVSVYAIPSKNQMISASENGDLASWDIETGQKVVFIQGNNKKSEVFAFAVDEDGEYAVTGHVDGTGNLWNLLSGKHEKALLAYSEEEITNCVVLPGASIIFMLGWSKRILAYKNRGQYKRLPTLRADPGWSSIKAHKDDIISGAYWRPHYLATGTFDGDIFIWHIEHERLWRKIQVGSSHHYMRSSVYKYLIPPRTARSGKRRPFPILSISDGSKTPSIDDTLPVDLILYLRHRNHETHAPLLATEGNKINWWSTVAIGKPVASFLVSEETDTSITALTSGAQDNLLIVGNNRGEMSIWDIEKHGAFQRFADVVIKTKQQSSPITNTCECPPPRLHVWNASQGDLITSLSSFERDGMTMVIIGMVTGCVSLFRIDGGIVGMFNKIDNWSFKSQFRDLQPEKVKAPTDEVPPDNTELVDDEKPAANNDEKEASLPAISNGTSTNVKNADVSNIVSDVEKIKNTENYKTRNAIVHDANQQKESWSMLGEKYNSSFKRRMEERRSRRLNFSDVNDSPLKQSGGLGNLCSPFQALTTKDCEDFVLPRGLPVTPRMMANSIDPYVANSLENITSFGN